MTPQEKIDKFSNFILKIDDPEALSKRYEVIFPPFGMFFEDVNFRFDNKGIKSDNYKYKYK